ncbi:MAG: MBL fold metallo-hydrolase [Spirochaetes bacterium]|nr:MBL fold metallo-hydrolase [Spirochaetota bacterium]
MNISFTSYGAAREVTGSKHMVTISGKNILVDCGLFQGKRKEADEKNRNLAFDPASVDCAILTHGHLDHCGIYPVLVKNGFRGQIFCTPSTAEIATIVMNDSARIQTSDIQYLKKKAAQKGLPPPDIQPLYTEANIPDVTARFHTVDYRKRAEILPGIYCTFHDAGHILGSAGIVLESGGVRFGLSGDLGRSAMPILRDPEFPGDIDYFVCESTYGNRLHDEMSTAEDEVAAAVMETYRRGGKVIIPAFSIGRTQEIIYLFHRLMDDKRLPHDLAIYVDSPMSVNITEVFKRHEECYDDDIRRRFVEHRENPFGFSQLKYIASVEESKSLNSLKRPAVIISASGMCESGRVLHHLANNIGDPASLILVVGFMAEHTLGRRLAEKQRVVRIFGEEYDVLARLKNLNAFSAHADYHETLKHMERFDKTRLKNVFLVHGEDDALSKLRDRMSTAGYTNVTIAEPGTTYTLS